MQPDQHRKILWVLVPVLLLAACVGGGDGPAPVTAAWEGGEVELQPWSWCWSRPVVMVAAGGCADGQPQQPLPTVDAAERVVLSHPVGGWEWDVTATPSDTDCGRSFRVPTEVTDEGGLVLLPPGPVDTYDVTAFGRTDRGDLSVTFAWKTPAPGPVDEPSATLALLAAPDGDASATSYGVELHLTDLSTTAEQVTASVVAFDALGRSAEVELSEPTGDRALGCMPPGDVRLEASDAEGREVAAALGEGPWRYEVRLVMDGTEHLGRATYPDDIVPDADPLTELTFAPPLPGSTSS